MKRATVARLPMSGRPTWELELEIEDLVAANAAYREALQSVQPEHPLLGTLDAGRAILDRLRMAEEVSHDSVVDGLFELRDALANALSLVRLDDSTRVRWRALADVLKRWGESPLQLTRRVK